MGKKYVTPFLPRGYHTMAGKCAVCPAGRAISQICSLNL